MEFSLAQFQSVIDKIRSGLVDLNSRIHDFQAKANQALSRTDIPQNIRDGIKWVVEEVLAIVTAVVKKIIEVLEAFVAPVFFYTSSYSWETVRGMASSVVGNLQPGALRVNRYWTGDANDAYNQAVKPQSDATARIATICDKISGSLTSCAMAGLVFYAAIAAIVVKLIVHVAAGIALLGSAILSWAGLMGLPIGTGISATELAAAVTALTMFLGYQVSQLSAIHGEAVDTSAFPGGHWPDSTKGQFNDASVAGGSKWKRRTP
jgi:hypothetical protein